MKEIDIRLMREEDIDALAIDHCLPWLDLQASRNKWHAYYEEQRTSIRAVGLVIQNSQIQGYGSLLFTSQYPGFTGLPEINDIWVYEAYRKKGVGNLLVGWLEKLAKSHGYEEIGIGVGLYADYGSAQRLYIRLGYVPDGLGVTHKYQPVIPGENYPLDDELILWLKKRL